MKRTLQDQYLLIKEGKGHKDVFIKEAKTQFPGLIRNAATFNEIATVLKDKNIINENIVGLEPINQLPGTKKESFETAFENFLKEAKDTYFEDEKAEVKKTSKQVEDDLSHNFDRADKNNPDNMIFDQIMKGYYTEMKDPKNADKTMEQLKAIVLKNLEKNPIYYTEKGQFGVKDLGYTTEAPGLGTPKEPKGPHKSSGYGNLSEGIKRNYPNFIDSEYQGEEERLEGDELYTYLVDTMAISRGEDDFIRKITYGLTDETSSLAPEDVQKLRTWYQENSGEKIKADLGRGFVKESLEESKLRKVIRESIEKELATINKEAEMEILDSKLEKIQSAIEKRQSQLTKLDEDEDMKALTDKTKVKQIQKDIKALEKAKSKIEKQLSKKDKPAKSEIIDEDEIISEAPPTVDSDKLNKTFKDLDPTVEKVKKNLEDMSKINLEENYDAAEDMYDELIAQGYSNDEAAKEVAGDDKDLYNHLVGYSPDMDSDY
jgi:flavin-binding protein dodecin